MMATSAQLLALPTAAVDGMLHALLGWLVEAKAYTLFAFLFGPGLALAGRIGTTAVTAIAIAAFAIQVAVSRWWLARFRFGPLEWLWRAATYGYWPALKAG
jgi:uncharacterized protein